MVKKHQMVESDFVKKEYSTSEQGWFCEEIILIIVRITEFLELALDIMEIPKKDNGEIIEKLMLYFY